MPLECVIWGAIYMVSNRSTLASMDKVSAAIVSLDSAEWDDGLKRVHEGQQEFSSVWKAKIEVSIFYSVLTVSWKEEWEETR